MKPSTTERATSSRLRTRARTTGSTTRAPGNVPAPPMVLAITQLPASTYFIFRFPFSAFRPSAFCLLPSAFLHPRPRNGNGLEQLVDDLIARHALRLRVEVREHAMAQYGVRERADVVEADVVAAVRQRARLAAEHEVLRRADARAERGPLADELRRRRRLRPARARDIERVAHHRLARGPPAPPTP